VRRCSTILLAGLATLALGCGSDGNDGTPSACLEPASSYVTALQAAPGEVRLANGTRISDCLTEGQDAGELGTVGSAVIDTATDLNQQGRKDPGGPAPVELGYLVGALEEGAAHTGGIHEDLVRRLESAARFSSGGSGLPASFRRGFGQGFSAGQETG
jgi:hypothetical protein